MTEPAIITFNAYGVLFADIMHVFRKSREETVQVIRSDTVISDSKPVNPFSQLSSGFQVPFTPNIGDNLPRFTVIRIDEPYFVGFLSHICPKFIYFKRVIVRTLRFYLVFCLSQYF